MVVVIFMIFAAHMGSQYFAIVLFYDVQNIKYMNNRIYMSKLLIRTNSLFYYIRKYKIEKQSNEKKIKSRKTSLLGIKQFYSAFYKALV